MTRTSLDRNGIQELIGYWDTLTFETSKRRTALTSPLIPVREYTAFSGIEAWLRWPAIFEQLAAAVPPGELGAMSRGTGRRITNAHPFSMGVIPLSGWRAASEFSSYELMELPDDAEDRLRTMFEYWIEWAEAWRDDGFRSCWDAADSLRSCPPETIEALADQAVAVQTADENQAARRLVAGLQQFLFLLYLDTRLGTGDSGPYPLPNGRHMIVREFSGLSSSWIPWSDLCADVPYSNVVAGLVFRPGVNNRVSDLSTTFSIPADNLAYLEAIALAEAHPDGTLTPIDADGSAALQKAVRTAQAAVYRHLARWTFEEKVANGLHIYFRGILEPLTTAAGIDDDIDWTTPGAATQGIWPIFTGGLPETDGQMTQPLFPRLSDES